MALFYIVLILPSSYWIAVYRVNSCLYVSHLYVFLSVRCDSHWVVLDRYTPSYCIVVYRVYTVSILVSLYVIVAHLIRTRQATRTGTNPQRTDGNVHTMTNQQELTRIDTMFGDAVRIDFNSHDQYDCFEHSKTIILACGCYRSNTKVTAN